MSVLSPQFEMRYGGKFVPSLDAIGGLKMVRNTNRSKPLSELYVSAEAYEYAVSEVVALRKQLGDFVEVVCSDKDGSLNEMISKRMTKLTSEEKTNE